MQITVCDFCDERVDKPIEVAEVFTPDESFTIPGDLRKLKLSKVYYYYELCEPCFSELEEHKSKRDMYLNSRTREIVKDVPGTITYERRDGVSVHEKTKEKQESK